MSIVRVVSRTDGSVAVIYPALKSRRPKETESQWLDRVFTRSMSQIPGVVSYRDMDSSELPTDRTHRNAWEKGDDGEIKVNQGKAKDIDKKRLLNEEKVRVINEMAESNLKKKGLI